MVVGRGIVALVAFSSRFRSRKACGSTRLGTVYGDNGRIVAGRILLQLGDLADHPKARAAPEEALDEADIGDSRRDKALVESSFGRKMLTAKLRWPAGLRGRQGSTGPRFCKALRDLRGFPGS